MPGHRTAAIEYRAGDGPVSTRRVEPYRVVSAAGHWYLMAYDLERADWRTLRLDRMTEVDSTGTRLRPRPGPDPVEYVRAAIAVAPYRFTARVLVHATAAEVARHVSAAAVLLEPVGPDRCLLVAGGEDLDLMAWHVARLPFDVEVLEPTELRTAAGVLARRLAALADPVTDVTTASGAPHLNT